MIPENCIKCEHHEIISDPDPYDEFCNDDKAVVCKLVINDDKKESPYKADQSEFKTVTVSCRPYNVEKETTPPPQWCPKR